MNKLKKFLGSKKIFILSFLPSIIVQSIIYNEYLDQKNKNYNGCGWLRDIACKSYLDYIRYGFGGWELTIISNLIFIFLSVLFLGGVYLAIHKRNKASIILFLL